MDNFYKVGWKIASISKIKKAHMIIIADVISFNDQGMDCYKSQSTMAKCCGVTRKTINTTISELKGWGFLEITEQGKHQPLIMRINKTKLEQWVSENLPDEESGNTMSKNFSDYEKKSCKGMSKNCSQKEQLKEQLKDLHLHVSKETHSSEDLKASFQDEEPKQEQKPKAANDRIQPNENYPLVNMCYAVLRELKMEEGLLNIYLGKLKISDLEASEMKLEELISEGATEYHNTEKEAFTTGLFNLYQHGNFAQDKGEISLTTLIDPYNKSMTASVMVGCDYMNMFDPDKNNDCDYDFDCDTVFNSEETEINNSGMW